MTERITAAVLGGSGFVGAELVRLLAQHPRVELSFVSSEQHAGKRLGQIVPGLRNSPAARHELHGIDALPKVDVAIACLPNGVLPSCLQAVCGQANLVLNIAGDYRLRDAAAVAEHYPASVGGRPEPVAYYVPELSAKPSGQLVNLPGCMAVAGLYALFPLFQAGLVSPEVVVDAKTGSSGGGARSVEHPAVREGNVRVHRLHGHRHAPELAQALAELTGTQPDLQFSAFSLPVSRGVLVAAYSRLRDGVDAAAVRRAYAQAYAGKPFVRLHQGRSPMSLPMLKTVAGTNMVEVGAAVEEKRCVTVAALDNLLKGAAGQAVQALNRLHDFDETLGLSQTSPWP
jgi:[amino group carrier protein]-6-phospho-L-2-aminoadipate/5-phospho-L-glutamate reductase